MYCHALLRFAMRFDSLRLIMVGLVRRVRDGRMSYSFSHPAALSHVAAYLTYLGSVPSTSTCLA